MTNKKHLYKLFVLNTNVYIIIVKPQTLKIPRERNNFIHNKA